MNTKRKGRLRGQLVGLLTALAVAGALIPLGAFAQVETGGTLASEFGLGTGTDVRGAVINIVKFLLTFLGLFAVIVVLYGGFRWMTSFGNEERVSAARATLTSGIIGLIIILSAYAITQFVITTVVTQVTN